MTEAQFVALLRSNLPVGLALENPGGGTSVVAASDADRVCYVRGRSRMCVTLHELYRAYAHFSGGRVTTTDLKGFTPSVFDSDESGHNCHN